MRALLLTLLLPAVLAAQVTSCALSGTVLDAAGAVIPGAKVTLTGEGNGFVRTVNTSAEGFFSFPDLFPATFTLAVESRGFKTYRQTGVMVNANEQRSLPQIRLDVGQVNESVTVSAEAVSINLATGERTGDLTGRQLDEIALRGRDIFDAVSLMAGVVDTSDGRDAPGPSSIANIYILGTRNDQKNMTVDGVTNLDTGSNATVHSMPSMDSVAQVKVLMSAYSAENGRNPASINVITRGGNKDFHGSVSYYFRNEDLNANDYFSNLAGRPIARYRYNIGSYTFGGPVVVPKHPSVRNKLFFFWSQEFQRQVPTYGVEEVTVPTALERQGDFSQSYNTGGVPGSFHVNDPLNNKAQFPGNIVPPSRISPIGQAILNMFPLPNFVDPNPATRAQWNYYAQLSEPYPRRTETARIDYQPTGSWQLFLSLSNNSDNQNVPYSGGNSGWVAGSLNYPLVPIHYEQPGQLATLHSINVITPTMSNEASIAVSRNTLRYYPTDPSLIDRTRLGINLLQRNPSLNVLNEIPTMSFNGIQTYANPSLSSGTPYFNRNTIYSFIDNVSKIVGTHTIKAGVYAEFTAKTQSANAATFGALSFNQDGNNPLDTNNPYATALIGNYDTYGEATGRPQAIWKFVNLEWFLQDTWRVSRRFSLDYGVRFYHDMPQYDKRGQLSEFSPTAYNAANAMVLLRPVKVNGTNYAQDPTTGQVYNNGLVGDFAPGVGSLTNGLLLEGRNGTPSGMYNLAPVDAAPRLGFAWDPSGDGRTAIRGGGGVYLDRIQGNLPMALLQQPVFLQPTVFYGTFADIATSVAGGFLSPTGTLYSMASTGHQQMVYNFNLSIQRQLSRSDLLEVGYTGSLGQHLAWERNINPVPAGADFTNVNPQNTNPQNTNPQSNYLSTNFLVPYQGFSTIYMYEFANNSNYNSLQLSFQHRMGRSFNLAASYTFSKVLDCSDGYSSAVDPILDIRARQYGPAGWDRKHVFNANFFWNLPKPGKALQSKVLGVFTDNWQISGVVRMNTGGWATPGYSLVNGLTTPTGTPSSSARAEVISPDAAWPSRLAPPFQPAGYGSVPWAIATTTPQFGNLGRNVMPLPGTNNWDLSLYKSFRIGERLNSQLRLETYNTFNHTQFGGLNTNAQFNSSGQMINTAFDTPNSARPPRRMQIAVRISF